MNNDKTKNPYYKIKFPISYTDNFICGCVEHITDVGNGFRVSREYCKTHLKEIKNECL